MSLIIILITIFVTSIWYIRPLYNFFAIRKYVLLDQEDTSVSKRIKSGLPAIIFFSLILGFMFYPVVVSKLINSVATGSIIALEIIFIYLLTRYDKRQTKYEVLDKGVRYRKKFINWNEKYHVTYKKNIFIVLHKPRIILKSDNSKVVIPILSRNIGSFIMKFKERNSKLGEQINELYLNTKNYYIGNKELGKKINS